MIVLEYFKQYMYPAVFIVAVFAVSLLLTFPVSASTITIDDLYSQSNTERSAVGLPDLSLDKQLSIAALAKANNMIADDYWAHNSPSGATPWSFILKSGYMYETAGENLAKGFDTSSGVTTGWMESPKHRENILNESYLDVGYAVVDGKLTGRQTTLVVAMYGSRTSSIVVSSAVVPSSSLLTTQTYVVPLYVLSIALVILSVIFLMLIIVKFVHRNRVFEYHSPTRRHGA